MIQGVCRIENFSCAYACFSLLVISYCMSNTLDTGTQDRHWECMDATCSALNARSFRCHAAFLRACLSFLLWRAWIKWLLSCSGDRPRLSDHTAEQILQRIAQGNSSDLDLSDSDDDTIVDPSFSAPPSWCELRRRRKRR